MSCCAKGSGSPWAMLNLQMNEVVAGDEFGDGMLDLEAGVHLEEVEILVVVDEEFDGAGVGVTGGLRQTDGGFAHARRRSALTTAEGASSMTF